MAAAFSLVREHIIPGMFRSLLMDMNIDEECAPVFQYYLNRHVELDEEEHWPMALGMLKSLCSGDIQRERDALNIADRALRARVSFWNEVEAQL